MITVMDRINTKDAIRILNNAMDIAYLSDVLDDTIENAVDIASDMVDKGEYKKAFEQLAYAFTSLERAATKAGRLFLVDQYYGMAELCLSAANTYYTYEA